MIKVVDILSRYEGAEFGQLEAAELLGVGERTFRRWRQRYDDDEAGLLDRRLGKASGKRMPSDRQAAVRAALSAPLEAGLRYENELNTLCFHAGDHLEGTKAFQENRTGKFAR